VTLPLAATPRSRPLVRQCGAYACVTRGGPVTFWLPQGRPARPSGPATPPETLADRRHRQGQLDVTTAPPYRCGSMAFSPTPARKAGAAARPSAWRA